LQACASEFGVRRLGTHAPNHRQELIAREGLGKNPICSSPPSLSQQILVCRNSNHRQLGVCPLELRQKRQTGLLASIPFQIQQDNIRMKLLHSKAHFLGNQRFSDYLDVVGGFQNATPTLAGEQGVVRQQNGNEFGHIPTPSTVA
jgi:hypothetical protein